MPSIEEHLTGAEFEVAEKFLGWCFQSHKTFGRNLPEVFQEFANKADIKVEPEMLPCPFCGKPPEIHQHFKEDLHRLIHRCKVMGPMALEWTTKDQLYKKKCGHAVCL